jgi:hypothetical protein
VVVDTRKAQIFERQMAKSLDRLVNIKFAVLNLL